MFDIGATELLVIVIVAIIAIGPKDMPLALRTAGRWIGKMRRMSGHFRAGLDNMIREAEMEEHEREWRERNARIMQAHPQDAAPASLSASASPAGADGWSGGDTVDASGAGEAPASAPPPTDARR